MKQNEMKYGTNKRKIIQNEISRDEFNYLEIFIRLEVINEKTSKYESDG